MKSREEKNWELIQQLLAAEASGREYRPAASQRTLFGIRSQVEETIDRIVAEDEARLAAARSQTNENIDAQLGISAKPSNDSGAPQLN